MRARRWLAVAAATVAVACGSTPVGAQAPPVPDDVTPTVVRSVGVVSSGLRMGTGWLAADGVVVTNFHVSKAAVADVTFTPSGGSEVHCWVAAADRAADLVALRCPQIDRPVLRIAERAATLGEPVVVVGYPGGVGPVITTGEVVELERLIRRVHTLQFTAAIEPGSSGSPVVGSDGQVLAVATFGGGFGSKADKLREIVARAEQAESSRGRQSVRLWLIRSAIAGLVLGMVGAFSGWRSGTGTARRRALWSALAGVAAAGAWTLLQTLIDGPTHMVT